MANRNEGSTAGKNVVSVALWTHGGERVVGVKNVGADGVSYRGKDKNGHNIEFPWPDDKGEVVAPDWEDSALCGGGLHFWPWGMGIGDGKDIELGGRWYIIEADPADISEITVNGKSKCRACHARRVESLGAAMAETQQGRIAWIQKRSSGAASQVGDSGAASQVGYCGAASQVGDSGAASQVGDRGAASQVGYGGAASQAGYCGAASQVGYRGAASQVGYRGAASQVGHCGAASQVGDSGAASQVGDWGAASQVGDWGAASQVGDGGAASQVGDGGAASQVGDRGAASQVGYCGAASQVGYWGAAVVCGEDSTVEADGPGGICAVCGNTVTWIVHPDAVLVQRWRNDDGTYGCAIFYGKDFVAGQRVNIVRGAIQ